MADEIDDAALSALFAAVPGPRPDPAFVRRVERAVRAEQALAAARTHAWQRFRGEALATIAIAATFGLLWEFGGSVGGAAWAAVMVLALWFLVALRPIAEES